MGGTRGIWNIGQAVTDTELQRMADAAAHADEVALEVLATPMTAQKTVLPMMDNDNVAVPRLLCRTGAAGVVTVQPCALVAAVSPSTGYTINLSGSLKTSVDSAAMPANASGGTRWVLVYASLARAVTATAARKFKSPTQGGVSTQTLSLASEPTITLAVSALAATEAAALAAPNLPADTSSTWYFPLCTVELVDGYTAGTALLATALKQQYVRGGVPAERLRGRSVNLFDGSDTHKPTHPKTSNALGAPECFYAGFLHKAGETASAAFDLDDQRNWRHAVLHIVGVRGASEGAGTLYPAPAENLKTGASASFVATMITGVGTTGHSLNVDGVGLEVTVAGAGNTSNDLRFKFGISGTKLQMKIGHSGGFVSDLPLDNANGDSWSLLIWATPFHHGDTFG